jgi:hypothetical protein
MMNIQTVGPSPKTILQRIDAIIQELEELREMVLRTPTEPPNDNLAQQLYGALGQGNWNEYDPDLDWQRFAA